MRTPSPHSERDRRAVQSRIQSLLSGQRPRHPTLSRVSTGRLILEGIVEEVRIYRLNREREVMRERGRERGREKERRGGRERGGAREDGSRGRDRRDNQGRERRGRGGEEKGESGGRGIPLVGGREEIDEGRRGSISQGPRERRGDAEDFHGSSVAGDFPVPNAPSAPTSPPPSTPSRRAPESPGAGVQSRTRTSSSRDASKIAKGKQKQKDPGPGPFPKWKPKLGPLLGLGDHLKDRYNWGVENHHHKQRKDESRKKDVDEGKGARKDNQGGKRGLGKEERNKKRGGGEKRSEEDSKRRSKGSPGGYSKNQGPVPMPDVRGGKSYTNSRPARSRPEQDRHEPIPVYETTSHSQRVEERERTEALRSEKQAQEANRSDSQTSYYSDSSQIGKQGSRSDVFMGSLSPPASHKAAPHTTRWSSKAAKSGPAGRKYDPYGGEDEYYHSNRLGNETDDRTESARSERSRSRSRSRSSSADKGQKFKRRSTNASRTDLKTDISQNSRNSQSPTSHLSMSDSYEHEKRSLSDELGSAVSRTNSSRSSMNFETRTPPRSQSNDSDERGMRDPVDLSPSRSCRSSISHKAEKAPNISIPPPPPPPGPPPTFIPPAPGPPPPPGFPPASRTKAMGGRSAMLSDIKKGFKLKKVPDHEKRDRSNAENVANGTPNNPESNREYTRQSGSSPGSATGSGDFMSELMAKMNARRQAE